jgi:hypothetical protein
LDEKPDEKMPPRVKISEIFLRPRGVVLKGDCSIAVRSIAWHRLGGHNLIAPKPSADLPHQSRAVLRKNAARPALRFRIEGRSGVH